MMITSTFSPAVKIGLQFLGIWPNIPYSNIYWLSFMSSMLIIQYFQYLYIFEHLSISELSNLIDGLTLTLYYSLTFFKLLSLWIHRRVFHKILADMDNDWRECINVDQHLHMMTIKANISHFISNTVLSFNIISAIVYLLGDYAFHFVFPNENYNSTLRKFPIKIQFPFETQQSPTFEVLVLAIIIHVILHVCTVTILNGLIFTLVLHASGQIDIICQEFRNISRNILLYRYSVPSFGMVVERHNRIISLSKDIEKLFSFVALMQIVWNSLVICGLGFAIIICIHTETGGFLAKGIFGICFIMIEAFIICFAGEYLSLKNELIANATYETLWYNMPTNASKIIIFVIMRSQKRLTITAGKMMDMSFETFTNIVKASTSYISVLNAIY